MKLSFKDFFNDLETENVSKSHSLNEKTKKEYLDNILDDLRQDGIKIKNIIYNKMDVEIYFYKSAENYIKYFNNYNVDINKEKLVINFNKPAEKLHLLKK